MQEIITATGKVFQIIWCGLSTIDNALRFEIKGKTMQEVLAVFTDQEETEVLIHSFDNHETEYTGFTLFTGVDMKKSGTIVVTMEETT